MGRRCTCKKFAAWKGKNYGSNDYTLNLVRLGRNPDGILVILFPFTFSTLSLAKEGKLGKEPNESREVVECKNMLKE